MSERPGDECENGENKCRKWLENCSLDDCDCASVCSSQLTSTDCTEDDLSYSSDGVARCDRVIASGNSEINLGELSLISTNSANIYQNVNISKSKKVHLGNVTYIQGPIIVNQAENVLNQITNNISDEERKAKFPQNKISAVRLVDRKNWLAQPPLSKLNKIGKPAKLVIICHSATDEGSTQSENILHIRLIQQFHVESRGFDDIGYNFLIGCDGNTYLGRGWGIQGAHTKLYNTISVGICFVGCFIRHVPSQAALRQAKALIQEGVEEGHIDPEYILLGASQLISTESPGTALFEQIKTWPRFNGDVTINTASDLLGQETDEK